MLLGGIHYLLPVIKAAHEQGYYVITADNVPDNIAHKHSDEYVNVSIVDKNAVLSAAQERAIDGIISFGVDPGVEAAAYVQEQMHLPSMGPYESVRILQNKDLFRVFLRDHGFNVPNARGYVSVEEALYDTGWLQWPMIVKPTDSAGSKGVTRVDRIEEYEDAVKLAFAKSIKGHIVVEQFIEQKGYQTGSDSFMLDGHLAFVSYDNQLFDSTASNPYTPAAHVWPTMMPEKNQRYLTDELQRLLALLHMGTSILNIEARVGIDDKVYIMEVAPRGGGNRLSEVLYYATGVDMITAQVRAAVGDSVEGIEQRPYDGYWAEIILHVPKDGKFKELQISDAFTEYVVERDVRVHKGEEVHAFRGANDTIGALILRFENEKLMWDALNHQKEWLKIIVE